jgi:hypothetical protein
MRNKFLTLFFLLITAACLGFNDPMQDLIKSAGDASVYTSDNLLIIFDSTLVNVKESGLSYVTTHTLTKILNYKGALDMNVVKFGYDPLSAFVEIKKVTIYRNDGTIQELDLKSVMDYPAPARAIYWGAREKMIEIGRLNPGDAVEVVQFKKGFTYALLTGADNDDDSKYIPPMKGHYYDIVEFWNSNPVKTKVYRIMLPKGKPLQYEVYNGELKSSVLFQGEKTVYTFTKKEILPVKSESRMVALSDVATKLLLSTSPDWYSKSKWFYKVNEDFGSFNVTPEVQVKVNSILRGSKTELDSISRLTHWVADEVRYSGISMGCGEGYTLHKGAMTFSDRCGVCKDKAGMLITMLRAAGFKSYPAMTMAGSRIDYIPADQFNHSVTIVKLKDKKYHLLDPTWVPFVRELWSSAEQQQQYLMGVPEGADLATTPLSPAENHFLKIDINSALSADGTLTGSFSLIAEGQTDAAVRNLFRNSSKTQWLQIVEKEFLKISPLAEVSNVEYGDPINYMAGPIQVRATFRIPGYADLADNRMMITPLSAAGIFKTVEPHLSFETGLKERKYAFRDRCSRQVEMNETIQVPPYVKVISLPEAQKKDGNTCSFNINYMLSGTSLALQTKFILGKRVYEAQDWPAFRDAVNAQNSLADEPVIIQIKN